VGGGSTKATRLAWASVVGPGGALWAAPPPMGPAYIARRPAEARTAATRTRTTQPGRRAV